jgi:hypothetical protein
MRIVTAILGFLMLCHPAMGFLVPLTTEQRIAKSTLIAVIEVKHVDDEKGRSGAIVIQAVLGTKAGERIEIWDDWQIEADGSESRISGRDPNLEVGKHYLVYLTKNQRGRLVTVQSSLDCLKVNGEKIHKEGEEGFEPLTDKLTRIRAILAQMRKAEQAAP